MSEYITRSHRALCLLLLGDKIVAVFDSHPVLLWSKVVSVQYNSLVTWLTC